jgi:hypothetical protein
MIGLLLTAKKLIVIKFFYDYLTFHINKLLSFFSLLFWLCWYIWNVHQIFLPIKLEFLFGKNSLRIWIVFGKFLEFIMIRLKILFETGTQIIEISRSINFLFHIVNSLYDFFNFFLIIFFLANNIQIWPFKLSLTNDPKPNPLYI